MRILQLSRGVVEKLLLARSERDREAERVAGADYCGCAAARRSGDD